MNPRKKLLIFTLSFFLGCNACFLVRNLLIKSIIIVRDHPFNPTLALAENDSFPLEDFFSKPLYFTGMGSQCIVFAPKEGAFVLKICKANRYQSFFPFIPSSLRQQDKKRSDFSNYLTAFTTLPEETGIVYLHLNKTDMKGQKIVLVDPLGLSYSVDASNLLFYIQKKAVPFNDYIKGLNKEQLAGVFHSLLEKVMNALQIGILIKDINPVKNIGFCQNKPIWIDPGRMMQYPGPVSAKQKQEALDLVFEYLEPLFPDLVAAERLNPRYL